MSDDSPVGRLRVDGEALFVEGLKSTRPLRLFLEGILGGQRIGDTWRLKPKARTLEELCIQVNRWLVSHGYSPELIGAVDVSVERDLERQKSFSRAREAAQRYRDGSSEISRDQFELLLEQAGWNRASRELREHQIHAAIHALTAANAANFSVPGAGKTATTLAVAAAHNAASMIDVVVVVGPLSSFQPWETETSICLPSWRTQRLAATATERRRVIRTVGPRTVLLTSYPGAVSDNAALKELCRRSRVMLVADESHRIKRFNGGQWAPAVIDIASLASVRMVLSGTPMPQSGLDLFSQLSIMWPGKELTGPKAQFKPRVERQFPQVIASVLPFVTRTSKAELGLQPPEIVHSDVELSSEEAEVYDLLRNHLRRALQTANPSEADRLAILRRGRHMRLLQAASNVAVLNEGHYSRASEGATPTLLARIADFSPIATPPAKFLAAGQIIRDLKADEKCVVWSNFIRNLDQFASFARDVLDIPVFQVDGRVAAQSQDISSVNELSDDDESREAVIARFLGHQGKAILVTNPASCSESISLHRSCRNAIYLDRTYDCAQWLQSIDRIHRLGLPPDAEVRVHVLHATVDGQPTADELVHRSLIAKESTMLQLLQGATLAPIEDGPDAAEGTIDDLRALIAYLLGRDE
ncbi:SNF2-related protein [Actinomadura sp. 1N219]|uniref:SNF2-related protein n=1 Tax=Actinomadura sp. 1N219 TaxID=3375152 RepID=UPI0037B5FEEB